VRRYVTLSRFSTRRPAAARAARRASAALLHSASRLHITWGNQEPFRSRDTAGRARSDRTAALVRDISERVRSRLPVPRVPSRRAPTATGTSASNRDAHLVGRMQQSPKGKEPDVENPRATAPPPRSLPAVDGPRRRTV